MDHKRLENQTGWKKFVSVMSSHCIFTYLHYDVIKHLMAQAWFVHFSFSVQPLFSNFGIECFLSLAIFSPARDSNGARRQSRRRLLGHRDAAEATDRLRRSAAAPRPRPGPNFRRKGRKLVPLFGQNCSNGQDGCGRNRNRKQEGRGGSSGHCWTGKSLISQLRAWIGGSVESVTP